MTIKHMILPAIFLTACGGGGESTSTPTSAPATSSAPVVQTASSLSPMERGAKLYKRCRACHTLEEGGKHKVGPNLWNVYGAKAGAKEGFNYSKVMAASAVIWTDETLDAYIQKPSTFMKGNRMSFVGIKKQEDRDAVLLYMKAKTTP
ncbi:c-type cytochrome [Hellea balneolensis]|uniref:c-type cytochrome n=1 Tax=Hellea balneolensis TaxID=287478 RepID=UPI000A057782|nr:cytochrome c family protein [Hellea balneolensis]